MSKYPVLIPFKTDNGRREELYRFCKEIWEQYGCEVITGTNESTPFIKSKAINSVLDKVKTDVFIFADADSYVPQDQLEQAIDLCKKTKRMVIPFMQLKEYTKKVTDEALRTRVIPAPNAPVEKIRTQWYGVESSVLVIPTEFIKKYGGWDERFYGWGGDDNAFAKKMAVLGHTVDPTLGEECIHERGECQLRIPGYGYHIWHPVDGYGKKANENNLALYYRWMKTKNVEDIRFIETPVSTTVTDYKSDNKYTIYLQDHHEDTYIHKAIQSIKKHIKGNYNMVLVDDSKDIQFKLWMKHKYPELEVVDVPHPGGYTLSMKTMVATMRKYSEQHKTIPINWQTDFIATKEIVLDDYLDLLNHQNSTGQKISQVNFLRPPVWEQEAPNMQDYLEKRIEAQRGGVEAQTKEHNGITYRVHNCGWSDNPSIVNIDALEIPFPNKLNGEYEYGQAQLKAGFWSAREYTVTKVEHIGEVDGRKYGKTH